MINHQLKEKGMAKLISTILLVCGLMLNPASAAEITNGGKDRYGNYRIYITGPIKEGDGRKFYELSKSVSSANVFLNSPGGLVDEGLSIAAETALRGYNTWVIDNSSCASMCSIIWMAGRDRFMGEDTVLDDYSRYIVSWKLCTNMRAKDVTDTLDLALQASGCDQVHVVHKPRLLSDNGSSYVSGDLAEWLQNKGMKHSRGAPYHPQTQGKIERWHQTLKNRILLENYFLPGDLEAQIEAFVDHYNHQRYHESLNNVTPADVYFGRDKAILKQRERIKRKTIETRRLHHCKNAA